ncbi:hypothetical protein AVEN_198293-1, partial [Araneus ventricosus]
DATSKDCSNVENSDIMCCTFEVTSEGELDDLKCECCDEPRPFACMTEAKGDFLCFISFPLQQDERSLVEWTRT